MKTFILFLLILAAAACQQTTPSAKWTMPSETPQPTASVPKNGNYNSKGVVTKIDLKDVTVELDHEEIKGVMPPMKMMFYVKEKSELEKLKVGDKVEFVLEYKDGQEKIISIEKAQ
jgi:Cu/Ag efflux protein CusF